jgi:hypothetical protein
MSKTTTTHPSEHARLEAAVIAIEQHRYAGFYDWYGIGELVDAAREMSTAERQSR